MNILLVSECNKKALTETRRIIDQFAERKGERTWQTAITMEGLNTLRRILKRTARRNTAVACHWIKSNNQTEVLWVVGNIRKFNDKGSVPTNTTPTTNTTKASNGVLSAASPVARVVFSKDQCKRPDIDEDTFEWCGDGVANHEARGIQIQRFEIGLYKVTGSLGFAKDSWHLKAPADPAGNGELGIVEGEEAEDGTLTIKLFKKRYKLNEETGDIDLIQGLPMDVPANSWIDVRMEMPAAEIPDLPIAEPEPTT